MLRRGGWEGHEKLPTSHMSMLAHGNLRSGVNFLSSGAVANGGCRRTCTADTCVSTSSGTITGHQQKPAQVGVAYAHGTENQRKNFKRASAASTFARQLSVSGGWKLQSSPAGNRPTCFDGPGASSTAGPLSAFPFCACKLRRLHEASPQSAASGPERPGQPRSCPFGACKLQQSPVKRLLQRQLWKEAREGLEDPVRSLGFSMLDSRSTMPGLGAPDHKVKPTTRLHCVKSSEQVPPLCPQDLSNPRYAAEAQQSGKSPLPPHPGSSNRTHSSHHHFRHRWPVLQRLQPLPLRDKAHAGLITGRAAGNSRCACANSFL